VDSSAASPPGQAVRLRLAKVFQKDDQPVLGCMKLALLHAQVSDILRVPHKTKFTSSKSAESIDSFARAQRKHTFVARDNESPSTMRYWNHKTPYFFAEDYCLCQMKQKSNSRTVGDFSACVFHHV